MTKVRVKVSEDNKSFVIYNHLFNKEDSFSIEELKEELLFYYGLDLDYNTIKYEIEEYINSGLVMHHLTKYKSCMR